MIDEEALSAAVRAGGLPRMHTKLIVEAYDAARREAKLCDGQDDCRKMYEERDEVLTLIRQWFAEQRKATE